jgi:hypothetical protein
MNLGTKLLMQTASERIPHPAIPLQWEHRLRDRVRQTDCHPRKMNLRSQQNQRLSNPSQQQRVLAGEHPSGKSTENIEGDYKGLRMKKFPLIQ